MSAVRTWLRNHDVTHAAPSKGDRGQLCTWSVPRSVTVSASCVTATQTYAAVTWQRTNTCADTDEEITSAGLFEFHKGTPTLIIGDSALGSAADCSACEGPAANPYEVRFVQQANNAVAYVTSDNAPNGQRLRVIVDGKLRDDQPLVGWAGPAHLWTSTSNNESSYRRWDNGWQEVARFPAPTTDTTDATAPSSSVANTLWTTERYRAAMFELISFADNDWRVLSVDERQRIQRALAIVEAPTQLRALAENR